LFKSKNDPNLEQLDPDFTESCNSNKTILEEDFSEKMANNNNNTIDMKNDKDIFIREYDVFDPNSLHASIVKPDITTVHFEFKPMIFPMLQNIGFSIAVIDEPHLHLKKFIEIT